MMDVCGGETQWNTEDIIILLQCHQIEGDSWLTKAVQTLPEKSDKGGNFFTEKSCKSELDRILSNAHPEHYMRGVGENYSRSKLVDAWITYFKKKLHEEFVRQEELVLVKLRSKADLFNRLFADDSTISNEEIRHHLELAREVDKDRDQAVVESEIEITGKRIDQLLQLHKDDPVNHPAPKISIPATLPLDDNLLNTPLFEGLQFSNDRPSSPSSASNLPSTPQPEKLSIAIANETASPQKFLKASPSKGAEVSSAAEYGGSGEDLTTGPILRRRLRTAMRLSIGSSTAASNVASESESSIATVINISKPSESSEDVGNDIRKSLRGRPSTQQHPKVVDKAAKRKLGLGSPQSGDVRPRGRPTKRRRISKTTTSEVSSPETAVVAESTQCNVTPDIDFVKEENSAIMKSPCKSVPSDKNKANSKTDAASARKYTKKSGVADNEYEQRSLMVSAWRMISTHRHASIFAHPVSDRDAHCYSEVIKSPMDLGTLKKQLDNGEVQDMREFARRISLMFANAVMFNSTGHDVNLYAKEMAFDSLSSLRRLAKDVLFVKGGVHITRRSAAFSAGEVPLERRKLCTHRFPSAAINDDGKIVEKK